MSFRRTLPLLLGRATGRLPLPIDEQIWRCLRLGKAHALWKLSGTTHAGTRGAVITTGSTPRAEYLVGRFFAEPPECEALGAVSVFQLRKAVWRLAGTADLVAFRIDRLLAPWFPRSHGLRVPEWLRSSLPIPERVESLATGHNSLRQDLRLIRKHGFTVVESHVESELEMFYRQMYEPHGYGRHGADAHLRSWRSIQHSFSRGTLLWVLHEGRRVGGVVLEKNGKRAHFTAIGALGGDEALLKMGVLSATYYFGMQHARAWDCERLDLGGTRPCVLDGLLRYKRKWGAQIDPRPLNVNDTIVSWRVSHPSIMAMLRTTPLVMRDGGRLSLIRTDDADEIPGSVTAGLDREWIVRAESRFREWDARPLSRRDRSNALATTAAS